CSSPNGFIELLSVSEDGVAQDGGAGEYSLSDYTITWEVGGVAFADPADGTLANALGNGGTSTRIEDLDAGTYTISVTNEVTGCQTSIITDIDVVLDDVTEDPTVQVEIGTVVDDTFCDNTNQVGDGALSVDIFHAGSQVDPVDANLYVVEWYRGSTVQTSGHVDFLFDNLGTTNADANVVGDALVGADISILSGLSGGDYTIFISKTGAGATDPNLGCDVFTTFTIPKTEDIPTLDETAITAAKVDNTNCVPNAANFNGEITITDADVSGTLGDYEITIEMNSIGGVLIHNEIAPASPLVISNLASAEYYISAQNATTGCSASAIRVNIESMNFPPDIQLVSLVDNLDCGGGDTVGSISVTADGETEANPNYAFSWYTGGSQIGGNASLTDLGAGTYTVQVDDLTTGCSSTQEFTLIDVDDDPVIITYQVDDQTTCTSNGSFILTEVEQTGVVLDISAMDLEGYTLEVFTNPGGVQMGVSVTSPPYEITGLPFDSYYAIVTNDGSSCPSDPIDFEVEDAQVNPVIDLSVTNDDPCSIGNGGIVATADGNDDTDADYAFNWYVSDGLADGVGNGEFVVTGSTLSAKEGGLYEIVITRTSTGCTISAIGEIFENKAVDPVINAYTSVGAFDCSPVADGSITITGMNQDDPQDYTFDLYDTDPTGGASRIDNVIANSDPVEFLNLDAGDYWIIATHDERACVSATPLQVTVEDISTPPVIVFTEFIPNTRCDPTNPNGSITAEADGSTSTDPVTGYTFAWTDANPTADPTVAQGQGTNILINIPAGTYDLTVINNATGCTTVADSYILTDESQASLERENISVSTSSNTNCVNFNGKMAATVIQPNYALDEYDYLWFIGTQVNPDLNNPDFTGSFIGDDLDVNGDPLVEDLANGPYTLVVRDTPGENDICESAVIPVFIEDDRPDYIPVVDVISDVTYCYANLPNGHAQVTNEDLGQYDIKWFEEADLFTAIDSTFFIDSLAVGNYQVKMTNLISGCEYTTSFSIIDDTETVSNPDVTLLSQSTNCIVDTGEAIATVNGATQNFQFDWFDASDTGLTTVLLSGSHPTSLAEGSYIVRATNVVTGCVSGTTPLTIEHVITDPLFEIVATNSLCLRTEDGAINQFNGDAYISFSSFNFVDSAAWFDESGNRITYNTTGQPITDGAIGGLSPGDYTVEFRADNGCDYSAAFSINTALQVFNFVTANGDTRNDFFRIDCLDFYPNNNVQIFTRAGQQVYEANNYNNADPDNGGIRFDGIARNGNPLPSGTYFYVIDKGDGSEFVQGYLELVR
ncbi:MAG: gliding motility-associated C-terminal domain-containing protein, partial [Cytophagales bacterium]|nr:gliding motility-associated C-terminal domain-containing protein [Cytophagales bacterium]